GAAPDCQGPGAAQGVPDARVAAGDHSRCDSGLTSSPPSARRTAPRRTTTSSTCASPSPPTCSATARSRRSSTRSTITAGIPRVVQKPHTPVWIAAISTEESFLYAARNGFNLMIVPYAGKPGQLQELVKLYRRVWAESGHKPGAEQVQVAQFAYVAEKRAEAQAGFERICRRYLETFADAVQSWRGKSSDQYPGYD